MKSWFCLLSFSLVLIVNPCFAADARRERATEQKIEAQLRERAPAAVDVFVAATAAFDAEKYPEAEKLFRQVVEQAADFSPALRRLGSVVAHQGRQSEGVQWVERALALDRSVANLITLARVIAFPSAGKAPGSDVRRALALIQECHGKPEGDETDVWATETQLLLNLEDYAGVRLAVAELQKRFPDAMVTHYFAAMVGALDEHWITAADEMRAAEKLGLSHDIAQQFLDSGVGSRATIWRAIRTSLWIVFLWALGLALLCGIGYVLSKATLRQIERADPTVPVSEGERRLRRLYRSILNLTGIYYYISLPVVAVLVVGASGGLIYGFLMLGRIPIKLTIIVVFGAIATIWAMGKSLFLKVETKDPGRELRREEAPGLWKLVEEVAQVLQTRPIDEIRVTVGTDLCVYERGNWREKLRGDAARVLVIGVAVLDGFKQEEFRSVLAHEYGHFANRDTAGGDIALRVQNDMFKFFHAMIRAGQASWFNAAFHFLRFYNFIFRRISHGATRLQEVLADRVAAQAFGAKAFEGGLTHVIRESILFGARAESEVREIEKIKRPVRNLYDRSVEVPSLILEKNLTDALNRPTTDDDTHPGPQDRFRLTRRVMGREIQSLPGDVWDLFADREALIREMMETVQKNVAINYA